ncbi:IS1 family transposase [Escherichia coli]
MTVQRCLLYTSDAADDKARVDLGGSVELHDKVIGHYLNIKHYQ